MGRQQRAIDDPSRSHRDPQSRHGDVRAQVIAGDWSVGRKAGVGEAHELAEGSAQFAAVHLDRVAAADRN